jgi:hypothetical protein
MNMSMIALSFECNEGCSQVKRYCVVESDAESGVLKCEFEVKDKCS